MPRRGVGRHMGLQGVCVLALVAVDTDTGDGLVTTERVAIVLRALKIASRRGEKLTTAALGRLVCIRWDSADEMIVKIERVTPELARDLDGWYLTDCWVGGTAPERT